MTFLIAHSCIFFWVSLGEYSSFESERGQTRGGDEESYADWLSLIAL